jgi:hypothetical protein
MQQMRQENIGLRARVAQLAADPSARAIAIGVTTVALAPVVLPLIKPVLKATLKSSVALFERTKNAIAETREVLADIAAEARAEAHVEVQKQLTLKAAPSPPKATVTEG